MKKRKILTSQASNLTLKIIIGQIIIIIALFIARFTLASLTITSYQRFAFNYQYLQNLEYSNQNLNHKLSLYSNLNRLNLWAQKHNFVSISKYTVLAPQAKNRLAVKD